MGQDAIAQVLEIGTLDKKVSVGTAFAISRGFALTAFHVIGDRQNGKLGTSPLKLRFWRLRDNQRYEPYECGVTRRDGDARFDIAILRLEQPLPEDLEPIPLTTEVEAQEKFVSAGHPAIEQDTDVSYISGHIVALQTSIFRVPAIQLFANEAGAEMPLGGMSGAPVLVGSGAKRAAVGLIRWNPTRLENPNLSIGGTVFACPVGAIVQGLEELGVRLIYRCRIADLVSKYPLPKVTEADCYELLGVRPTKYIDRYRETGAYPPYVPRKSDRILIHDFCCKGFVLLVGPSASGKSRTAYECFRQAKPGAMLIVPRRPESLGSLVEALGDWSERPKECVLWLDELDQFFNSGTLDSDRVRSVRNLGVQIVATIRDDVYWDLLESADISARQRGLFADINEHRLSGDIEPEEEKRARELYPDLQLVGGLGESFVAGPGLKTKYKHGNPGLKAVVRAAQDWRRTGISGPISKKELFTLFAIHIAKLVPQRDANDDATTFTDALRSARKPLVRYSALLLSDPKHPKEERFLIPDYVSEFVEDDEYPMQDKSWRLVLERIRSGSYDEESLLSECNSIVSSALLRKRYDIVRAIIPIGLEISPNSADLASWQTVVSLDPITVSGLRVYRMVRKGSSVRLGSQPLPFDGKWHQAGTRVVYCAESLEAAAGEFLAASTDSLSDRLWEGHECLEIRIPQSTLVEVPKSDVSGVLGREGSLQRRALVREWLKSGSTFVLGVPSAKLRGSTTYLLNPEHPDFSSIRINEITR